MIFCATRYSATLVPPSPSSVTFSPAVFGGFGVDDRHLGTGVGDADLVGLDAEIGQRQRRHFLLLRGHDALEGRVARLVDLLGDRDHRRQRRLA